MFIFENIEGNDSSFTEFEITGSTYEPIGEVFLNGQRVKTSEYEALNELGTICVMCNDSAIDFNEFKQAFEKVYFIIVILIYACLICEIGILRLVYSSTIFF